MKRILLAAILCTGLAVSPALAQDPAATAPEAAPELLSPGCQSPDSSPLFAPPPMLDLGSSVGRDDDGPPADCYISVNCGGSYQACWGSSCWGYDSNCPSYRGYCYGSSTGYRYCPVCPSCTVTASCAGAGGGSVSCTGTCSGSFAINDCYAYCDGTYHWCPNPGTCPI